MDSICSGSARSQSKISSARPVYSVLLSARWCRGTNREDHSDRFAGGTHAGYLPLWRLALLRFASSAQATPTFLSAINISDAGQDGFEPDVARRPLGQRDAVWTRSDGTNFRIQYSTRTANGTGRADDDLRPGPERLEPGRRDRQLGERARRMVADRRHQHPHPGCVQAAAGVFAAPVTISDPGFDATKPAIDFDNSGKALVTWQRFDGTKLRVQATHPHRRHAAAPSRTRRPSPRAARTRSTRRLTRARTSTRTAWSSGPARTAPTCACSPRGAVTWSGPRGRRGPRLRASRWCRRTTSAPYANRTHGPALAFPSCNPPVRSSSVLTVGTVDANGAASNMRVLGEVHVRSRATPRPRPTRPTSTLIVSITDVRNHPALTDYTGRVMAETSLQDHGQPERAGAAGAGHHAGLPVPVRRPVRRHRGHDHEAANCNTATTRRRADPGRGDRDQAHACGSSVRSIVKDAGPNGTGYASLPADLR